MPRQGAQFLDVFAEIVTQRLKSHLSGLDGAPVPASAELYRFLDTIQDILDGKIGAEEEPARVVRELPAKPASFDIDGIDLAVALDRYFLL